MQKAKIKAKIKVRKFKRKAHNFILKSITYVAFVLFLLSACAVDSESWIPTIVLFVSMSWLSLFAYANGEWMEGVEEW